MGYSRKNLYVDLWSERVKLHMFGAKMQNIFMVKNRI